jgi:hypothetical protein
VAPNLGRIARHDADIVEHGGFFDKLPVDGQFGMTVGKRKRFVGYEAAVGEQYRIGVAPFGAIFLDNIERIHIIL